MYVHVYMYVYIYPHTQKEQKNICHTYMTYIYVHDMYVCTHTHGCLSCVSARKKSNLLFVIHINPPTHAHLSCVMHSTDVIVCGCAREHIL